ncbi:MAG: inositol monophosphatase [Actinobacteria bacterium]|uniref:inositol-phosphate phosphatase n=1 Tax=freshwater metagenome TaxID=449393 RepID=A0A6J7FQB5_9ZZZZ|nr:inositol monophosphatase [Actinomycetota bacterium]
MSAELRDIARTIAVEAGHFALTMRLSGVDIAGQKSSAVDIVTKADQATERLIRERLATLRPHDGVLGEEGAATVGTSGLTWVVDPIDGTVNYLYGLPAWAVSIGVVEGDPDPATWTGLAGAVVNASSGEVFSAARGLGATCNDRAMSVTAANDLATSLIATGFAYSAETRAYQGTMMATILPRIRDIRREGASSLDLCAVAAGRVDAYFEQTISPWDHAAGALIAREAGALVGGFPGTSEGRDLLVAAGPGLYSQLVDLILESGATDLPGL